MAGPVPDFTAVLRGYEKTQVDSYVERLQTRLSAGGPRSVPTPNFTVGSPGYDIAEVDHFVVQALVRIAELEATVDRLTSG